MIAIRTEDGILDMEPGTRLSISLVSPLFSRDIGYGSFSYKSSLPNTPPNRKKLGFLDQINLLTINRQLDVALLLGGNFWKNAVLKVLSAEPFQKGYSFAVNMDTAALESRIEDLAIRDLNLEQITLNNSDQPTGSWQIQQDVVGASAAINVNGFEYSTVWAAPDTAYDVLDRLAVAINSDNANNRCTANVTGAGATAELNVQAIGTGPGATFYVTFTNTINTQIWLQQSYLSSYQIAETLLMDHINTVGTASVGSYNYSFFPVYNPDFYADQNPNFLGYINLYDQVSNEFVTGKNYTNTFVPFISVRYLILQVISKLGLRNISTFLDSDEMKAEFLYNNVSLDREGPGPEDNFTPAANFNYGKYSFDLVDHVAPDLSAATLFKAIGDKFNVSIVIDPLGNTIDFIKRSDAVKSGEKDWREKSIAAYRINFQDKTSVAYEYEPDDQDALFEEGRRLQSISVTNPKQTIKAPIAPLFEQTLTDPLNSQSWKVPIIKQQGNTELFELDPFEYNPRFMLFHGMRPDKSGSFYPTASLSGTDSQGNQLTNSIRWTEQFGLYEQYHKDFEPLVNPERNLSHNMLLNLLDILSLDWQSPYRVRVKEGEARVLLKSVSFDLVPMNRFPVEAKVELYLL